MSSKPRAKIDQWRVSTTRSHKRCLVGLISGHPVPEANSWCPGDWAQTSELLHMDEERGVAETRNTIYELGTKRDDGIR